MAAIYTPHHHPLHIMATDLLLRIFAKGQYILTCQESAESVSESTSWGWNRYRYRIVHIPGIGISIGIGPDMGKVSESVSGPKIMESPAPALIYNL